MKNKLKKLFTDLCKKLFLTFEKRERDNIVNVKQHTAVFSNR